MNLPNPIPEPETSRSAGGTCPWPTVTIVGVGLMGGSIGLALRERKLAKRVIGVGRDAQSLQSAIECGAITEGTTDLRAASSEADLIVVCTHVASIPSDVTRAAHAAKRGTYLTDVGSSKLEIVAKIEGILPDAVSFVGSHPLAGSHASGVLAATKDLFAGRRTIVTRTSKTTEASVRTLCSFWNALGSETLVMTPAEHDVLAASISHMPHVVASALASTASDSELQLTGQGWRDATRIASGDPDMWTEILFSNRDPVLKALRSFGKVLREWTDALEQQDGPAIHRLLQHGKRHRDIVGN